MVHVSLGTLSIHSVLCYQCYHVLSCVIVCYRVLSWCMSALVHFPSLEYCVISVIMCYRVSSCVHVSLGTLSTPLSIPSVLSLKLL